jgi:hypothetical protein
VTWLAIDHWPKLGVGRREGGREAAVVDPLYDDCHFPSFASPRAPVSFHSTSSLHISFTLPSSVIIIMKTAAVVAAAVLAGAEAKVHKMKMQKISLDEQLKSFTMHDMSRMLGQKYSRYTRGSEYMEEMFSIQGGHKVPVTNYMNAQCMSSYLILSASIASPLIKL